MKRILALTLTICMLLTSAAFAADGDSSDLNAVDNVSSGQDADVSSGSADEAADLDDEPEQADPADGVNEAPEQTDPGDETYEEPAPAEPVHVDTAVDGFASVKLRADKTLTQKITVTGAYGRTLSLEMLSGGKWVAKKTVTLADAEADSISLTFPKDWKNIEKTEWRIVIPALENDEVVCSGFTSGITVTSERVYQNSKGYIQIKDKITLSGGGYTLSKGYMGLKVRKVNSYFKIGSKHWPRYTATTVAKVKAFQKKKGLKVTGKVDLKTWKKMGFSEKEWYSLGAYVTPIKVNRTSTKNDCIEAMISAAYARKGSPYVVGASGTKSQGSDCSGFVMQCLYAAGIEMPGINPVTHSKKGHEYESRNIWKKAKFKKVAYKNRKRGDLIFYGSGSTVNHVAIYLGNNKIIHCTSAGNTTKVSSVSGWGKVIGVKRPFA